MDELTDTEAEGTNPWVIGYTEWESKGWKEGWCLGFSIGQIEQWCYYHTGALGNKKSQEGYMC